MARINQKLWEEAEKLASRNYEIEISQDVLSNGERVFIVRNPELKGCKAQSTSLSKALEELKQVRTNYIYFKLIDGRPVNPPRIGHTTTMGTGSWSSQATFRVIKASGLDFIAGGSEDNFDVAIRADSSEQVTRVGVIELDPAQK